MEENPPTTEPVQPMVDMPSESPVLPPTTETTAPAENPMAVAQPPAPPVVPATAVPDQDAVTLNRHIDTAVARLESAAAHMELFLKDHLDVARDLHMLVDKLKQRRL